MARPAKSIAAKTGTITKEETEYRAAVEESLQGDADKLIAPDYFTDSQRKIFNYILSGLGQSKILGNLDIYVLTQASIVIDRITEIEKVLNRHPEKLSDSKFMATQDRYFKQFARYCNELCLSPQSRAKLSIAATKVVSEKKTIMDVLNDDEE